MRQCEGGKIDGDGADVFVGVADGVVVVGSSRLVDIIVSACAAQQEVGAVSAVERVVARVSVERFDLAAVAAFTAFQYVVPRSPD